jgi:hypothetical protein
VGILIESAFIIYGVILILTSFIIRVEGLVKLYSKIFWFVGIGLNAAALAFLTLSWLTYFGITPAIKDANGGCPEDQKSPCNSFSGSDDGYKWGPGIFF